MAYDTLTLYDLSQQFGLRNKVNHLFSHQTIAPLAPSQQLEEQLALAAQIRPRSEKAKSEVIVTPILLELMKRNDAFFTIASGENLPADPAHGLNGEIDFLLTLNTGSFTINTPIISVVEAKRGELDRGVDQCAAQMLGASLFNQRNGTPIDVIYGCVTSGDEWLFLRLQDNLLEIDDRTYYLNELPRLLGVFQYLINHYKSLLIPS